MQKQLIKERVTLSKLSPGMWTEAHDALMDLYISDPNAPRLLVAYVDAINGLVVDSQVPAVPGIDEIAFFIKRDSMQEVRTRTAFVLHSTCT